MPAKKAAKPNSSKKSLNRPLKKTKEIETEKDLLAEALIDLNKELNKLRSAKKRLENKTRNVSSELDNTQSLEVSLRNKISELMRIESQLVKKKASTRDKMTSLDRKIEKVKSVERELRDVGLEE